MRRGSNANGRDFEILWGRLVRDSALPEAGSFSASVGGGRSEGRIRRRTHAAPSCQEPKFGSSTNSPMSNGFASACYMRRAGSANDKDGTEISRVSRTMSAAMNGNEPISSVSKRRSSTVDLMTYCFLR